MVGIDGDDLPQAVFTFGVVGRDGGQPDPGVLVARLGNQHKVKHLACLVRQPALRGEDGLAQQFFGAHMYAIIVAAHRQKSTGEKAQRARS